MVQLRQSTAGYSIGSKPIDKIGFHGATPAVRRANANQAAVATTELTVGATYSQSEVAALKDRIAALTTLVNELRAALVEKGLVKGAA